MVRLGHWQKIYFAAALVCFHVFAGGVTRSQTVPTSVDLQLQAVIGRDDVSGMALATLKHLGIPITEEGLIAAALAKIDPSQGDLASFHRSLEIRGYALLLLPKLSKSPQIVAALKEMLDKDDTSSIMAIYGLNAVKETGWEDEAVRRILRVTSNMGINMAGMLARAGRSEGWPVIVAGVHNDGTRESALREARHFEGLRNAYAEGPMPVINVRRELEALAGPSERMRSEIGDALKLLPEKKDGR